MTKLVGTGTSFLRQGMKFVHRSEDKDIELEDDWPLYCTREDAPTDPGTYEGLYKHYFTLRHDVRMFRLGNGRVDLEEFVDLVKSSVRENESLKPAADHLFELLKGVDRNFDTEEVPDSSTDVLASQGFQDDLNGKPKESLVFAFASEGDFAFSRAVVPFLLYNNYSGWTRDTREDHFLTEYLFITPLSDLEPTKVTVTDRDGKNERSAELASLRLKERYEKYTRSKDDERRAERPRLPDLPKPKVSVYDNKEERERTREQKLAAKEMMETLPVSKEFLASQVSKVEELLRKLKTEIGDLSAINRLQGFVDLIRDSSGKSVRLVKMYVESCEYIYNRAVEKHAREKKGSGLPEHMSRGHNFHSFLNHRRR